MYRDDQEGEIPEVSKSNIHGYIHGKWQTKFTTPEVLKKIRKTSIILCNQTRVHLTISKVPLQPLRC